MKTPKLLKILGATAFFIALPYTIKVDEEIIKQYEDRFNNYGEVVKYGENLK